MIEWWRRGPITKQLRIFLWSKAPVHYKISMMAYMFSYCPCFLRSSAILAPDIVLLQMVSLLRRYSRS